VKVLAPYYQDDAVTIYHGDCREILPGLEPVDLVLTDPPYGRIGGSKIVEVNKYDLSWDIRLCNTLLHAIQRKGNQAIIWGGNYYADFLPVTNSWLIWDKKCKNRWFDNFSDS